MDFTFGRRWTLLMLLLAASPLYGEAADTMTFSVFTPCSGNAAYCAPRILIEGAITATAADQLRMFLPEARTTLDFPPRPVICFNSTGGDIGGALTLGELIRSMNLDTCVAPEYDYVIHTSQGREQVVFRRTVVCASACVFALAGGVNREIAKGSMVGVHQFYGADVALGDNITQKTVVGLAAYLESKGVTRALLDIASLVDPDDIYWLTADDMLRSNLDNMSVRYSEWRLDTTAAGEVFARVDQQQPGTGNLVSLFLIKSGLVLLLEPSRPTPERVQAALSALTPTGGALGNIYLYVDEEEIVTFPQSRWTQLSETTMATHLPLAPPTLAKLQRGNILRVWVFVAHVNEQFDPSLEFPLHGLSRLIPAVMR